nr:hypothetical protein [Tanacetum cinerariifolium]
MELYMQNIEHRRMILESFKNGPLLWPTIEENGVNRTKKYAKLSTAEKIQADCEMKATNIILQGPLADIYSLERECKLYDAFDKFTHIKGESLHKYYLRFTQLINDMNIYNMKMKQFQVNTKFLNSLPPEWSKFVTDVKLVKDLHTTNFDQLHAYIEEHKLHANETKDHDTYDSDCDDISNAKAVLKANISNYGSNVILKVPYSETYLNDMENQVVNQMQDFEQPPVVDFTDNEIHNDSRLKCSTSNCGSKPTGNKKTDKISRTTSRNMTNKVKAQPKNVSKKNWIIEPIRNGDVKQLQLNVNSKPICDTCCPRCSLVSGLWMFETYDREPFSANELLVPNTVSQQPFIPPNRDEWDHLFQPMFDEYFHPPIITVSPVSVATAPRGADLADSLVSTSIDQDAPSTQEQEHSLNISQGFKESSKTPTFCDDPLHENLTSQGTSSNVRQTHTSFESLGRWTKYHLIANVIDIPSCSLSMRKQLQTNAMWCYFDGFLNSIKPKNFKQAMTEPLWIDAIQEKIHELERLQV